MSALIARIGTPIPGRQAEAHAFTVKRAAALKQTVGIEHKVVVRFGGRVGQIVGLSTHNSVAQIAELKAKVIRASNEAKIPTAPAGVFHNVQRAIFLEH